MTEHGGGPLVVLGMHRSGTSTVTRLLALAGAPLPRGARPGRRAHPANPTGFWEVPALTRCNEQVLRVLGGRWSSPPTLAPGWTRDPRLAAVRRRGDRLARRHLQAPGAVWKDPRLCLVLPFWEHLVAPTAPVVLVLRHPLEVAASLQRRNGFDLALGLALWERYLGSALGLAAGRPVLVVRYEQVVDEPHAALEAARHWLATVGAVGPDAASDAEATAFVLDDLRHNRRADDDASPGADLTDAQHALHQTTAALVGAHPSFVAPPPPAPDGRSVALLEGHARPVRRPRGRRRALAWLSQMARTIRPGA